MLIHSQWRQEEMEGTKEHTIDTLILLRSAQWFGKWLWEITGGYYYFQV